MTEHLFSMLAPRVRHFRKRNDISENNDILENRLILQMTNISKYTVTFRKKTDQHINQKCCVF